MECNKSVALFIDFIYLENQSEQLLSQKDILPTDSFFFFFFGRSTSFGNRVTLARLARSPKSCDPNTFGYLQNEGGCFKQCL